MNEPCILCYLGELSYDQYQSSFRSDFLWDNGISPAKQMSRTDNAIFPSLLAIGASKPVANITSVDTCTGTLISKGVSSHVIKYASAYITLQNIESEIVWSAKKDSVWGFFRAIKMNEDPERSITLFWAAIIAGDKVDSALKDMANVLKQQNRSEEAIEAIISLRNRCSVHAQESLDNILLELYKVNCMG